MTQPMALDITISFERWKAQYEFPCEVSIDAVVQRLRERHPKCTSMVIYAYFSGQPKVASGETTIGDPQNSGHTQAKGIPERLTKS
jgi:hypothetical protein